MKPDLEKYDAVIFDLFHTLINPRSITAGQRSVWNYLQISEEQWRDAVFSQAEDRLRGRISKPGEVVRDIIHKIDPTIPRDRAEHASQLRLEQFKAALSNVQPNVMRTIRKLKKQEKVLGIISNADQTEVVSWAETEISSYFDSSIFSCNVGYIKPEKEIYLQSLEQLRLSPCQCLFVGDGGNDELSGAKETGMDTAITLEFLGDPTSEALRHRRAQADFEICCIDELVASSK